MMRGAITAMLEIKLSQKNADSRLKDVYILLGSTSLGPFSGEKSQMQSNLTTFGSGGIDINSSRKHAFAGLEVPPPNAWSKNCLTIPS